MGAGTIGASWAAWFLSRGIEVQPWTPRPEAEANGRSLAQLAQERDAILLPLRN